MKLKSVDRTILVQSSNIDPGDVLPDYARSSIIQMAGKYFGRLNTASVHFNRDGIMYRCTVNVQMGTLRMMSGEAKSTAIYAAFRLALERVAKQLRRAKRELREDKAERLDKHLDWPGVTRLRRPATRLPERGAPGMPVKIDPGSADRVAAQEAGRSGDQSDLIGRPEHARRVLPSRQWGLPGDCIGGVPLALCATGRGVSA